MIPRVQILWDRFFARHDRAAVLAPWGKPCPVDIAGIAEQALLAHLEGGAAPKVSLPRMDEVGKPPFIGRFRIGSYVPDCEGNTPWVCIDVDGDGHAHAVADPLAATLAIKAAFDAHGIPVFIEMSGGGAGWHLWVFFDPVIPAAEARQLALAIIPSDIPLAKGGFADPQKGLGIEVFPKQTFAAPEGFGNLVWLPWWYGAKGYANQFHVLNGDGNLHPHMPESFSTIDEAVVDRILAEIPPPCPPAPSPKPPPAEPEQPGDGQHEIWKEWRRAALAALSLEQVYGEWLTGKTAHNGWLECRVPWSPTGDRDPSGGVADGAGEAERGEFHDFTSGETLPVFDFLVRQGRASDFNAACALIAELTGIPTPSPFKARRPVSVPSGSTPDADRTQPTLIEYVNNSDHVSDLFDRVVEAILPANQFFNMNGKLVHVQPGIGLARVTEANLNGLLSPLVEVAISRQGEKGLKFQKHSLIPGEFIGAFVWSPLVLDRLPRLREYTRSPVFDLSWEFVATPGYHSATCIYYDGPRIQPVEHARYLEQILADFCWKGPADRVNYVGMLLTALSMPHWITGHPLEVFNGNKPGVGKSLLGKIHAILVDGRLPQSVSFNPNDEEFEKQLATRVDEGDRIIMIDNAKGNRHVRCVESQILERVSTDPILNFRRLGSNTSITRENDVIFCLTMNFTQLSRDLRRRHIPVNLEQSANVQGIKFPIERPETFVAEHRLEIIAELAGMIVRWCELGRPQAENPAQHSISSVWAATIDSILRANARMGFLINFDESEHAFDPDYERMVDICEAFHTSPAATAAEWAKMLAEDLLKPRFTDRQGNPKPPRSQATIVGNLFNQYLDVVLETSLGYFKVLCAQPGGGHSSKTYQFTACEKRGVRT